MTMVETEPGPPPPERRERPDKAPSDPISRLARTVARAARFSSDAHGLDGGQRAALARMDPDAMRPHQVAALSHALIAAELEPENWQPAIWRRWALIAHGMALAGHDGGNPLGQQLSAAKIAESRVTRLLTARGEAFRQLLPRLVRLLAAKEVAPNWRQLGRLILQEGRHEPQADAVRLQIARDYFSALAKSDEQSAT